MAGSRFIRTVTYGGYDKSDVIRRLDSLYEEIFGLQNELRETKLLLDGSKDGKEIKEALEGVLAEERAKLTEAQKENESLSMQLKTAEESNKKSENEIKKLTASLEEANSKLKEANSKLSAAKSNDDAAALSEVFVEAKKSADMLEKAAQEKAEQLKSSAAEAAENSIAFANDEGSLLINDAERKAAEIIADAKNAAGEMETAYDNMRASLLSKMVDLGKQLNDFKDAIMKFEEEGVGNLYKCEELLGKTEETLKEGGIPEFKEHEKVAPEYPERPARKADPDEADAQKRKHGLDKLRQMAESMTTSKGNAEAAPEKEAEAPAPEQAAEKKAETPEPAAEKKAEKLDKDKGDDKKKSGKLDLAAIAKQAKALNNK